MPLNILIINQSDDLCGMLCRFFTTEGHKPVCVSGDKTATQKALEGRPDLIIIEVSMPELHAIELANRLHSASATKHIPVIVISDFPDLEFELLHLFDFISKPLDLVRLREDINSLSNGKKKRDPAARQQLTHDEHQLFHDFLIRHCGLHFERRNIKVLERGLESRMTALRINLFSDYYQYLEKNMERRQELQKLLQFLTVGETFFFRYHAHFEALEKSVLPALTNLPLKKSLRVWSAGCSTGEEPYSIAMAIMESFPDWKKRNISIYATDINSRSLRSAKEGVYNSWKIRVTPKHYLEKYFNRIGESYIVSDEVKSLVDFSYFNLQSPPSLSVEPFDIIFCRNVMIYFTTVTTKKVVEKFTDALSPGGYLFLGHSETLANVSSRFERHIHEGGFYYTKKPELPGQPEKPSVALQNSTPQRRARVPEAVGLSRRAAPLPAVKQPDSINPETLFINGLQLLHQENYPAAAEVFRNLLQIKPQHTGAILAGGQIHLAHGRSDEALSCFDKALLLNDLLPEGYFLRGLLFEMGDRVDEAIEEYRKAVLLKIDFIMPHYQLGKLCFRTGDVNASGREFRNSLKLLEKAAREAIIPFSGGLSREVFLEQVRKEIAMVTAASED